MSIHYLKKYLLLKQTKCKKTHLYTPVKHNKIPVNNLLLNDQSDQCPLHILMHQSKVALQVSEVHHRLCTSPLTTNSSTL